MHNDLCDSNYGIGPCNCPNGRRMKKEAQQVPGNASPGDVSPVPKPAAPSSTSGGGPADASRGKPMSIGMLLLALWAARKR